MVVCLRWLYHHIISIVSYISRESWVFSLALCSLWCVQIIGYIMAWFVHISLLWRHNGRDGVSNHQPYDCLLNRLFRRRSKKTSELRVTGLCEGKSSGTGEFPAQMASNAENVSIWWRHHVTLLHYPHNADLLDGIENIKCLSGIFFRVYFQG